MYAAIVRTAVGIVRALLTVLETRGVKNDPTRLTVIVTRAKARVDATSVIGVAVAQPRTSVLDEHVGPLTESRMIFSFINGLTRRTHAYQLRFRVKRTIAEHVAAQVQDVGLCGHGD